MRLTIEICATEHHENLFDEFAPTANQIKRAQEVRYEWTREAIEIEVPNNSVVSDLINTIVSRRQLPADDSEGERIVYNLAKVKADTSVLHSKSGLALTAFLAHNPSFPRLESNGNLSQQGVRDGDRIILYPGLMAGGPDPLTIAAGIAAVAQVFLMIVDMWSRKREKRESRNVKPSNIKDEVKEIRVQMSDGKWVKFDSWRDDPNKLRSFVETFNIPASSPKPLKIVFLLTNGYKGQMTISDKKESKKQLDQFVKYLQL